MDTTHKLQHLERHCRSLGSLAVAFSGGLDSRFLCHVAKRARVRVRALHIAGPHIPRQETEEAREWAESQRIPFVLIQADPLDSPDIRANGMDRCYHCKRAVFKTLNQHAKQGETVCDGTNASDQEGYRPGLKALEELGIVSPLAAAGITKDEIRALAKETGMDRPDQKARPCLFTRFEYGLEPDAATLSSLDAAEQRVEQFFARTFPKTPPFRLRLTTNGPVLHVEAPLVATAVGIELSKILLEEGFPEAPVECVDRISGFFDRERHLAS